jgi:hypothetical protein
MMPLVRQCFVAMHCAAVLIWYRLPAGMFQGLVLWLMITPHPWSYQPEF